MTHEKLNKGPCTLLALAIAILTTAGLFLWQGAKGFSLRDEGFLWYGVQRVLEGEVPIRDFMAYDPGRYYWTALILNLVGDSGIMSLRAAVALFQWIGLSVGIFLVAGCLRARDRGNRAFLILSAAVLVLWMFPRHKLFDMSLSIFLIATHTFLVSNPTRTRYVLAGLAVGVIAVFGRNHGLYGALASLGVIAWIHMKGSSLGGFLKAGSLWMAGTVLGFSPIVAMAILVPGFAGAFLESMGFLFDQKATNLPLPVPWPWTVHFSATRIGEGVRGVLVGIFFLATLLFGIVSVFWVVRQRIKGRAVPAALVAAAFLSLPYAHYAFSRADVGHLAHGIYPLLIGILVILAGATAPVKWTLSAGLLAASFWVMYVFHPGWYCYSTKQCVGVEISGSRLMVDRGTASDIELLRGLADTYSPHGRTFLTTPYWPGAYALLERRSPMWEIYALFPRSEEFQRREIKRIAADLPGFAVVIDLPMDGRDELTFRKTHPLIDRYITENFEPVTLSTQAPYRVYKAREVSP